MHLSAEPQLPEVTPRSRRGRAFPPSSLTQRKRASLAGSMDTSQRPINSSTFHQPEDDNLIIGHLFKGKKIKYADETEIFYFMS